MAATDMSKMSSNNLIIVLMLVSFLVVGGAVLVGKGLLASIWRDAKVVDAKSKASKQLEANLEAAPRLVSAYSALGAKATLLADALPTTTDLPGLLVLVENLAGDAGVKVKTIAPLQTGLAAAGASNKSTPTPQVYGFSLTFDGTYASLQRLLTNLEMSARPMRVVGLQLNGSGSALSGSVDVQTFYQDKAKLPFSTETIK